MARTHRREGADLRVGRVPHEVAVASGAHDDSAHVARQQVRSSAPRGWSAYLPVGQATLRFDVVAVDLRCGPWAARCAGLRLCGVTSPISAWEAGCTATVIDSRPAVWGRRWPNHPRRAAPEHAPHGHDAVGRRRARSSAPTAALNTSRGVSPGSSPTARCCCRLSPPRQCTNIHGRGELHRVAQARASTVKRCRQHRTASRPVRLPRGVLSTGDGSTQRLAIARPAAYENLIRQPSYAAHTA